MPIIDNDLVAGCRQKIKIITFFIGLWVSIWPNFEGKKSIFGKISHIVTHLLIQLISTHRLIQ